MTGRWLVLGSHIPPGGGLGGMIRYTVEVTRALERRPDVEVHVHCRRETVPFLERELGIAADRLHPTATGRTVADSLVERLAIGRLGDRIDADVVLCTKQLVPRSGEAIRLLTVHDMLPFDRPGDFGPTKRMLLPTAYRRSIRDADVLACVSDATRRRLLSQLPEVADRAVVVPNAMTRSLTEAEPAPIPALDGRTFALMVGDRSRRKNAGFVVRLWPEVVRLVPGAHLALIGPPGWGRNEQLPELADLVAAGAASDLGLVSERALHWAYRAAAVTLCPSLLEGFGLPVVEALALGCPVLASPDPAQVEAAGGAATVVDLADRAGWVDAIAEHLRAGPGSPAREAQPIERSWDDVADELVAAVAAARVPRARPERPASQPTDG